MPTITHSTTTRNAICTAVAAQVDFGTTNATGRLRILTSADVLLVEIILANPSFATPSGGSMQINAAAAATPVATGTAAWASFVNRNNAEVLRSDVTASGGGGGVTSLPSTTVTTGVPIALTGTPITYSAPT